MSLMRSTTSKNVRILCLAVLCLSFIVLSSPVLCAQQGGELAQRIGDLKDSTAKNKELLAHYTWVETVTISLKGEQKKIQHYQVVMGPDGKPVKTSLDPAPPAQDDSTGGRGGRLKQRIVTKKKEEYEDYAEQMKSVAAQYLPPNKDLIQAAYQKGNASFAPVPGDAGQVKILIHNYLKPNDSLTIVFDKTQKQIANITIATYLSDPSDAMNLTVNFSRIPDGPSHLSSATIEGVSKQLTVVMQNSNYVKQY
jgi:hypothetical protein